MLSRGGVSLRSISGSGGILTGQWEDSHGRQRFETFYSLVNKESTEKTGCENRNVAACSLEFVLDG